MTSTDKLAGEAMALGVENLSASFPAKEPQS